MAQKFMTRILSRKQGKRNVRTLKHKFANEMTHDDMAGQR
jgi:hypothetical protein